MGFGEVVVEVGGFHLVEAKGPNNQDTKYLPQDFHKSLMKGTLRERGHLILQNHLCFFFLATFLPVKGISFRN